jgi:hypothetical protein
MIRDHKGLPPGRVIRARADWYGITLDEALYGDVYYCDCGPNLIHTDPKHPHYPHDPS